MHWAAVDIMKCRLKIKLANLLPGMRNPVSLSATFAPEALRATVAAGSRRRTSSTTRITAAAATIGGLLLPAQQRPRPRGHHWPLQLSRATITATAAVATMPPIPTTTAAAEEVGRAGGIDSMRSRSSRRRKSWRSSPRRLRTGQRNWWHHNWVREKGEKEQNNPGLILEEGVGNSL